MTGEIYTGERAGGQQGTALINGSASIDSGMPSRRGRDGQPEKRRLQRRNHVRFRLHEAVLAKKDGSLQKSLKAHEMHSFCLRFTAAVINPSLLPWAMAGGMIISLHSEAGDSTLFFIIHHSGQVFWKVLGNCSSYWNRWSDPTALHLLFSYTDAS